MKRCSPKHLRKCDEDVVQKAEYECKPFSFCTTQGEVSYDGRCMTITPNNNPIADGWYTAVQFVGGCLVGAAIADSPGYTPPDCCGGTGGGGGGAGAVITLNPDPANVTISTAGGLLSKVYFQNTTSVTVTGSGTASDPFKASTNTSGAMALSTIGTAPINVVGSGIASNPFIVSLNTVSSISPGEYAGFTIDSYGRVIGYDANNAATTKVAGVHPISVATTATSGGTLYEVSLTGGVISVTGGQYIKVNNIPPSSNSFQVELDANPSVVTNTITAGQYTIKLNALGGVVDVVDNGGGGVTGSFLAKNSQGNDVTVSVTNGIITNIG